DRLLLPGVPHASPRLRPHAGPRRSPARGQGPGRPLTDVAPLLEFAHPSSGRRAVPRINEHYLNLQASYLFAEIKRRTAAFRETHPDARVISLGVGDVTQPLPPAVILALQEAAGEMAHAETFRGYGPYVGYEFLRAEIAAHDFGARGV